MTSKFEKQKVEQDVLVDVLCDRCGKSCKGFLSKREDVWNIDALSIEAKWGYTSPWDTEVWNADLCTDCARKLKAWIERAGGKLEVTHYL